MMLDENHEVTVPEMLDARDRRVEMQREMLASYQHPVICFMLNIPGPHKVGEDFAWAFQTGCERIHTALKECGIRINAEKRVDEVTGYIALISAEADAIEVKRQMCLLEDQDRLGRIFDIDVLRVDGSKVSREDFGMAPRKCLMCEQEAHLCARNRTHKVADMVEEIHRIIQNARGEA
jgi:holo-ACP synthase/holo-ACP synthase/triphosphoribosyl-dephospho-CoA synthase